MIKSYLIDLGEDLILCLDLEVMGKELKQLIL